MNRIRLNIIAIFLALAIFSTGNFAFAINQIHCEMECCEADDCCESNESTNPNASATDNPGKCCEGSDCCESDESPNPKSLAIVSSDKCCEFHADNTARQDLGLSLNIKSNDKLQKETLKDESNNYLEPERAYTSFTQHKFITSNIYLLVLSLRI